MSETLTWSIEKLTYPHQLATPGNPCFLLWRCSSTYPATRPSLCQAHLSLHTLDTEEDIFLLVEELKHASLQPSEGGCGFTVFR